MKKKTGKKAKIDSRKERYWISRGEFVRLQDSLREAQESLQAISSGEVDAVVINGPHGHQIYSLTGAEQPYRVYVERMQEGAVTISNKGLILYCNQRFAEMALQPLERVIGSDASRYLDPPAWQSIYGVLKSANEVVKCETHLHRLNENSLPVNLTASQLPLEDQNVICLVVTDLSVQKLQQELLFAKEVAEKANLAKDTFLATLSHELRTPLNPALLLASEAAKNLDLPESVRADFATICNKIELEARLIDDLLDLTRIVNDKLVLEMDFIDARTAVAQAIETVKSDILNKEISFSLELDQTPGPVKADLVRLQQAFWNVLSNAVKFTPKNGAIKVFSRVEPKTDRFVVQITDSGIGITPEEMPQIFESFVQGDHAQKFGTYQFGGLGLGLPISRKIIRLHSGEITARSEGRGRGATFTIEIPLNRAKTKPIKKPASAAPIKSFATPRSGLKILLVEDHEATRHALTQLLMRRNHRVKAAGSLAEARALAAKESFQLVISDIGLPDGTGFELMQELKKKKPKLKGIALTGYGMEQDILTSQNSGFFLHLTKPVRMESLDAALAQLMG